MPGGEISVMVHLVGEQPLPNLFAALSFRAATNIFIHSRKTRPVAERLVKYLNQQGMNAVTMKVKPNDYHDNVNAILSLLEKYGGEGERIWFNITGGTKIMSLVSTISAMMNRMIFFYYDYMTKRFLIFAPKPNGYPIATARPLNIKLGIRDILFVHGYTVETVERPPTSVQVELAELIGVNALKILRGCGLRKWQGNTLEMVSWGRNCDEDLKPIINQIRRLNRRLPRKRGPANFLAGGWLEVFVYNRLKPFMDEAFYGVKVISDRMVHNEIDFLGVRDNELYVVSCKTVKKADGFYKDHIAEIEVLSRLLGGLFPKKALVSTMLGRNSKAGGIKDRAEQYGIKLITLEDMERIDEKFAELFGLKT